MLKYLNEKHLNIILSEVIFRNSKKPKFIALNKKNICDILSGLNSFNFIELVLERRTFSNDMSMSNSLVMPRIITSFKSKVQDLKEYWVPHELIVKNAIDHSYSLLKHNEIEVLRSDCLQAEKKINHELENILE